MELLKKILDDIGTVFRHFLPGALLLFAAYVRRPDWFSGLMPSPNSQQLVVLSAVGITVGNLAYVFNRYVLIQFAESVVFRLRWTHRFFDREYANNIAQEIVNFYGQEWNHLREIVRFRDASSTFLLAAAEAFFLAWSPDPQFKVGHVLIYVLRGLGIVFLISSFWGHMLARLMVRRYLDDLAKNPPSPTRLPPTA